MQLFLQISYLSEHQVELMAGLELAVNTGGRTRGVSLPAPGLLHLAVPAQAPIFLALFFNCKILSIVA